MITTIQLSEKIKMALSKMKKNNRETYEEVIVRMIKTINDSKSDKESLLREGYKEMAKTTEKTHKEWSLTDSGWD